MAININIDGAIIGAEVTIAWTVKTETLSFDATTESVIRTDWRGTRDRAIKDALNILDDSIDHWLGNQDYSTKIIKVVEVIEYNDYIEGNIRR